MKIKFLEEGKESKNRFQERTEKGLRVATDYVKLIFAWAQHKRTLEEEKESRSRFQERREKGLRVATGLGGILGIMVPVCLLAYAFLNPTSNLAALFFGTGSTAFGLSLTSILVGIGVAAFITAFIVTIAITIANHYYLETPPMPPLVITKEPEFDDSFEQFELDALPSKKFEKGRIIIRREPNSPELQEDSEEQLSSSFRG
jgi:hypothetical protein